MKRKDPPPTEKDRGKRGETRAGGAGAEQASEDSQHSKGKGKEREQKRGVE